MHRPILLEVFKRFAAASAIIFISIWPSSSVAQTPLRLTIDPSARIASVSPTLYGLMTEEINFSYDGGLYAEMIRNRTFAKDWSGIPHWYISEQGSGRAAISAAADGPSKALPHSLKLTITAASPDNEAGVVNEGYWGMAVRPSTLYRGSFYAKTDGAQTAHIRLVSDKTGATLAEARVPLEKDTAWRQYRFQITSKAGIEASAANHFVISFDHPGTVLLQLVSLFPPTFQNRPNGNRPDLMRMMAAMHPHFLRLPGGNYLEGDTFKQRFNWKETIGPLVDRPTHRSPWNYRSSDGMGLLEYMEWCEDLKVEPVLAVFAGYSLKGEHATGAALQPYVQDALDEIEYLTGDSSTTWGAKRAQDGHPKPFSLHYIEIGNEDQFDRSGSYDQRFTQFATAIRARYPQYKLIATAPVKSSIPDVIDDHFYKNADEFFAMVHHYDDAPRNGPKIFVGEWATRMGSPTPNFAAALGDAAWMTGMERNSDLIVMASYAPLFVNVNPGGMQWSSDLIGYDALRAYGSPSYWAQVLFAGHLGDHTVKASVEHEDDRFFFSATVSPDNKVLFLKLVNASDRERKVTLSIAGVAKGQAEVNSLHAASRWATNTIDQPDAIRPVSSHIAARSGDLPLTLSGNTIEVLDIPLQ